MGLGSVEKLLLLCVWYLNDFAVKSWSFQSVLFLSLNAVLLGKHQRLPLILCTEHFRDHGAHLPDQAAREKR